MSAANSRRNDSMILTYMLFWPLLHYEFMTMVCTNFFFYRVSQKTQQLRLKSAIFHVMSWKFRFNKIRGRRIRIWNRISDISIPSAPKSRSKNQKTVKTLFVRILNRVNLREAHGNKTLVLLQRAQRASTPRPQGEVYEPFRASRWVWWMV